MEMNLQEWTGRQEIRTDLLHPTPYAALAATLDRDPALPPPGTALPPLWHWLYFLPLHRQSELGHDGHARRGGFLPPVPLPRRMWAGGRFTFARPLCIGDTVERVSTIERVEEKSGRSGALVFVTVRHELRSHGSLALTEYHDIVYRNAPDGGTPSPTPAPQAAPATAQWERRITPDDVLLFRYSALTFNGHRIHYDRNYVTGTEGYPGLVVHGPLIATLLLDLLRDALPAARVATFAFRALRPTFDLEPFYVAGAPRPDGSIHLWARDRNGNLAMDASATLGEAP
jgi:3-methylfumaryl-CoA hydratase